ncbi:MAG: sigma-54-dependent Fis family transcriptional regulator [Bradymonadales bacterium]|nr:sigma-54-dependent Fis family transcriptional regulator [Bradymonadales bacterium]
MARILVVDDERSMREFLAIVLTKEGHEVDLRPDGESALAKLPDLPPDLVLTDLKMGLVSGMEVLQAAKRQDPSIQVIVMTAFGSTETAVQAMKEGAADYITKPFKVNELKVQINKALQLRELQRENLYLKEALHQREGLAQLVGQSLAMQRIYDLIIRLARTRTTVLITGESGTGKELVARAVHQKSEFAREPFMPVSCAAIPTPLLESELFGHLRGSFTGATSDRTGLFEAAGKGTLFLDEVGELGLEMQVKLLRVLQERKVKRIGSTQEKELYCRVMAASNKDLFAAVAQGTFREDLYYRLNVVQIHVPPLRQRAEDIPPLVEHFLRKYRQDSVQPVRGVTKAAMQRLMDHRFDGNIRELENIIQRAIALATSDMIDLDLLPPYLQAGQAGIGPPPAVLDDGGVDLDRILDHIEKQYLVEALKQSSGVRKKAAELLGISFRSLRYRLDKHDIDPDSSEE